MNKLDVLGKFLRTARKKSGLKQHEVTKLMGYSTAQFCSNWERGLSYPPPKSVKKLSRLYGINQKEIKLLIYEHICERYKKALFGTKNRPL